MIDTNTLALFRERYKSLTADGRGDDNNSSTRSLTLGMVVNTDDPLEQGRLQIFCPALNDNPKKIQYLPWCAYVSPFGGSINNEKFTRGVGDGTPTSKGAIHYGFWGVPELGAHVLVGCIDGDPRRRFWVGCIPEHQETHTMFNGRFDWTSGDGTPDGPLTSDKEPIQPLYDNWTTAFVDRKAREWKSRGADYEPMAVTKAGNGAPSRVRGDHYLDETYEGLSSHEKDEWVKEVLGAPGYDWSGFKGVGAFKSSRVYGMTTPGFHSFSMDDRPFNSRMKFRTATGHLLLMDDTNERIYIMTNKGNNWVEMDGNGNIDVYSSNRVSISAAKDINLSSTGSIRMHAAESIHMYAGHNVDAGDGDDTLTEPPVKGEIRINAQSDVHTLAANIRSRSSENTYNEVGMTHYNMVGDSSVTTVQKDISVSTVEGDHILSSGRSIFATSTGDTKHFAQGKTSFASMSDAEIQSFTGTTSVAAKQATKIKSMESHVDVEAGSVSGSGSVKIITPMSQHIVGDDGINSSTSGTINHTAGTEVTQSVQPGFSVASGMSGALLAGIATGNVVRIGTSDISMHSAMGDIIQKTATTGHSYTALATQVDTLTMGVDTLTYQVGLMGTAISTAMEAVSGSFTMPFTVNVGCLIDKLYGMLPPALTNVYATLNDINNALSELGQAVTTLEDLYNRLSDTSLLSLLGLPTTLNIGVDFSMAPCLPQMPVFSGSLPSPDIIPETSEKLRDLIHSIYHNGSSMGSAPPLTTLSDSKPCPVSISSPTTGVA